MEYVIGFTIATLFLLSFLAGFCLGALHILNGIHTEVLNGWHETIEAWKRQDAKKH